MNPPGNLLVYGGMFDPVHVGHLGVAKAVQTYFRFDRFIFMPAKAPVLKLSEPVEARHRIAMLKLALAPLKAEFPDTFAIDTQETDRNAPSWMVVTLEHMRKQYGSRTPITLMLGMDAYLELPRWHQWTRLSKLVNILVISRPDVRPAPEDPVLRTQWNLAKPDNREILKQSPCGHRMTFDAGTFPVSSSVVRSTLTQGLSAEAMLPAQVLVYIRQQKLYRPTNAADPAP